MEYGRSAHRSPATRRRLVAAALVALTMAVGALPFGAPQLNAWTVDAAPRANDDKVAAGQDHVCAIDGNDVMKCWGSNLSNQGGQVDKFPEHAPVTMSLPVTPTKVAAGASNTCIIGTDGSVWCWGVNGFGQSGPITGVDSSPIPVKTTLRASATSIAAGAVHTCATLTDLSVWCWGSNIDGQLGDGTTTDSPGVPVQVTGVANAASVSAGFAHTCILTTSQTVSCWGSNVSGQLGNGSTVDSTSPVQATGLSGVTMVEAGSYSTCAVAGSTAKCWGENINGQLGIGSTTNQTSPAAVTLNDVVSVNVGVDLGCFVTATHGVWCSGKNTYGGLGVSASADVTTPVQVTGLTSDVTSVDVGESFACAQKTNGSIYCWGSSGLGQVPVPNLSYAPTPLDAWGTDSPTDIAVSFQNSCQVRAGNAYCWGTGSYGVLGNGAIADVKDRTAAAAVFAGGGSDVVSVRTNSRHSCALRADSTLWCWGLNNSGQLGDSTNINKSSAVQSIGGNVGSFSIGDNHTCAVMTTSNSILCFGMGNSGRLGSGATTSLNYANPVVGVGGTGTLTNIGAVAAGSTTTCALTLTGTVYCWGYGGRLGNGGSSSSSTPVAVSGITTATEIGAGTNHTCALKSNGTVWCWGDNNMYQLGDNSSTSRTSPVQTQFSGTVTKLAVGADITCGLLTSGSIECAGRNDMAALGNNSFTTPAVPVAMGAIPVGNTVSQIAVSSSHICVRTTGTSTKVFCTGVNSLGIIGSTPVYTTATATLVTPFTAPSTTTTTTTTTTPVAATTVPALSASCSSTAAGKISCTARKPAGVSGKVSYRMVCTYGTTRKTGSASSSSSRVKVTVSKLRSKKTHSCTLTATKSGTTKARKTFTKKAK